LVGGIVGLPVGTVHAGAIADVLPLRAEGATAVGQDELQGGVGAHAGLILLDEDLVGAALHLGTGSHEGVKLVPGLTGEALTGGCVEVVGEETSNATGGAEEGLIGGAHAVSIDV
jgi:hypothetical protein